MAASNLAWGRARRRNGVLAPAKTPRNSVSALNAGVVSAMQSAEMRDRLVTDGSTVVGSSADELGAHIHAAIAELAKLVTDAKIPVKDAR